MRLLLGASRLLVCWSIWLGLGFTSAGRALVEALGSPDKNLRSIAGMLLVKSGKRAEPLLLEAANRRESLPMILTVLGSIRDPAVIPQLRRFTEDEDPDVANAAREALKVVQFAAKKP
jgi:HEAT repeat protein